MLRFFLLFIAIQIVLFGGELYGPVQASLVIPWTATLARISAGLLQTFDPDVHAYGVVIQSLKNGFGVSIQPGCNGVEACIILIAAMLAFPAPWKYKLAGIGIGIAAVQGVNIVRVISLFYLGQWNMKVFEFAHLYLWQALIMLDVLVVWLLWVRFLAGHSLLPKFKS
ncbi:MAG: exosortase H [Hydrogenophilales bacterium CG03_land_8_20_14_0_80_62_28]|nr:exosortase H [Betaproteobacteria bacterium]OIO76873.1 MAG: exosortase H [Hydrogenophilaceae bacterium CG1_02_62_390]PIV22267.1 MAG: exosortase H [Hydrogenophilales bacterium CG03_land_8_20_14_0_80_62_28]PIW39748.1 MAG: exosortase H [Hydrogenophilales bacterium CG15_BIG_FIL_POST_REV_8_21_14_020_62_31]PIW72077.1 MAG: exosortase H [Hydrogenophilales bacterium CG12_big_fil_rev_8_21_14_0_65_61_21]PIX01657.1 MAG: exosortase H [Hydrogenophilales bacterium CG_4_8_14_3_um_filter_62_83]PIY98277.1 MA